MASGPMPSMTKTDVLSPARSQAHPKHQLRRTSLSQAVGLGYDSKSNDPRNPRTPHPFLRSFSQNHFLSSSKDPARHVTGSWAEAILRRCGSLREVQLVHCGQDHRPRHSHAGHDHQHHQHQQQQQSQHCHSLAVGRRWGILLEKLHRHRDQHSLASVELAGWLSRASSRRGSSLNFPLPLCPENESVQAAIIKLFQKKTLKENELATLQDSVRALSAEQSGLRVFVCYRDQLLRKGMVILREKIKNEQGAELMRMLGETWDYFYTTILPTLQALLHPLGEMSEDYDIRNTTLLEFRNIVVLKVALREAVDTKKYLVPANVRQMLLVLQGLNDPTFLSKDQLDLEKLVACVVVPFLGSRGLYQGGPDPVTKANYRPSIPQVPAAVKPKITITVSETGMSDLALLPRPSHRLLHADHHPIASPAAMRKGALQEAASSHSLLTHKLKPVMEIIDVGRRHSIVGT